MTGTAWAVEEIDASSRIYRPPHQGTTYDSMLSAWARRSGLSFEFIRVLADVPFRAYLWETPPINSACLDRPFEFAVTRCHSLDRAPDPEAFSDPLADVNGIASFPNLGQDAFLISPGADPDSGNAAHLGAFARSAALARQLALWRTAASAIRKQMDSTPLWLSTSGLGVPWLHLRLDSTPKYYAHAPYRITL